MSDLATALRITAACAAWMVLVWGCVRMVRWAKHGGGSMKIIGATLMLFGWGNMRDPRNDTVAEAQDGRIRKGTDAADPVP
ncbi:MAG: hypothetical protein ABI821_10590 [Pseudomonadota bacterium]